MNRDLLTYFIFVIQFLNLKKFCLYSLYVHYFYIWPALQAC